MPNTKSTSEREPLSKEEKKIHKLGISKLLFLMQYSTSDIIYIVQELSK